MLSIFVNSHSGLHAVLALESATITAANRPLLHSVSLLPISAMRRQPILKCGKHYVVIDTGTAYVYQNNSLTHCESPGAHSGFEMFY